MIYWYHPPDYWAYLAFSGRVNLQIMEQSEAERIPFARPALKIHMADKLSTTFLSQGTLPGSPNEDDRHETETFRRNML
jgi:hypothetical protein